MPWDRRILKAYRVCAHELISSCAILSSRVDALLKSIEMTITYGLSMRRCVIVWSNDIIAAVGDPLGLKAYWSEWRAPALLGHARTRSRGHALVLRQTGIFLAVCLSGQVGNARYRLTSRTTMKSRLPAATATTIPSSVLRVEDHGVNQIPPALLSLAVWVQCVTDMSHQSRVGRPRCECRGSLRVGPTTWPKYCNLK